MTVVDFFDLSPAFLKNRHADFYVNASLLSLEAVIGGMKKTERELNAETIKKTLLDNQELDSIATELTNTHPESEETKAWSIFTNLFSINGKFNHEHFKLCISDLFINLTPKVLASA